MGVRVGNQHCGAASEGRRRQAGLGGWQWGGGCGCGGRGPALGPAVLCCAVPRTQRLRLSQLADRPAARGQPGAAVRWSGCCGLGLAQQEGQSHGSDKFGRAQEQKGSNRSCQCHSQHPQHSSRAGGAAHSAPGVAAHYPNSKRRRIRGLTGLRVHMEDGNAQRLGRDAGLGSGGGKQRRAVVGSRLVKLQRRSGRAAATRGALRDFELCRIPVWAGLFVCSRIAGCRPGGCGRQLGEEGGAGEGGREGAGGLPCWGPASRLLCQGDGVEAPPLHPRTHPPTSAWSSTWPCTVASRPKSKPGPGSSHTPAGRHKQPCSAQASVLPAALLLRSASARPSSVPPCSTHPSTPQAANPGLAAATWHSTCLPACLPAAATAGSRCAGTPGRPLRCWSAGVAAGAPQPPEAAAAPAGPCRTGASSGRLVDG